MKPMLATDAVADKIRYPVLASVKVDGVRAVIRDGVAYSRTLKPIPNQFIQQWVKDSAGNLDGLDGELVVGEENAKDVMQKTMSGVMRKEGEPDFKFMVFDMWNFAGSPYNRRATALEGRVKLAKYVLGYRGTRLVRLQQFQVNNSQELDAFEARALGSGFEGVMIRDPTGLYKYGRSTVKEGDLLKVKRFVDSEAEVIGYEERMHNANEATRDELGRTKRSTAKSGLVPAGDLGALVVRDLATGVVFNIGTGFTADQRKLMWSETGRAQEALIGKIAKYKSFAASGVKEAPRFPVFLGFRDAIDIGDAK
jgi:DNA ligase-1